MQRCRCAFVVITAVLLAASAAGAGTAGKMVLGVSCSEVRKLGIDRQLNIRASMIMVGCGLAQGGAPSAHPITAGPGHAAAATAAGNGGPGILQAPPNMNIDVITGGETSPHVTQSETMFARNGNTVVVGFNDSRDAPSNYSGVSTSTDGGSTFTRLLPSPFAAGHGTNYGDPLIVYDRKLGEFVAVWLGTGCGGQGLGSWTSTDGLTWVAAGCAHSGSADDRASLWTDNNPASPYYGRLYVSLNDFNVSAGALEVVSSDDGSTWSAPVVVSATATFMRDVQITGSPDSDGRVYLMSMNEGGGGLNNRQNVVFYSTDGGGSWNAVTMGSPFAGAGDTTCGYFEAQHPNWRDMGWGQPAAGPNGLIAYDYTAHGAGADPGDIYFTRSTDYGITWSAPVKLNGDTTTNGQWQPSLAITDTGELVASWYDRRNSTDGSNYEFFYRKSPNGGLTWQAGARLSNQLIAQPQQPDPSVQACYAGDYNNAVAYQHTVHMGWTDGRVSISGNPQQDVVVSQITALPVLYDQYDNLDTTGTLFTAVCSQDFPTNNQYDSQAADDFVVPAGQRWQIRQVEAAGYLSGAAPSAFNVFIYSDGGNKPGTQIFAKTGIIPLLGPALNGGPGSAVALPISGLALGEGHYWISVQAANKDDIGWFFYFRTVVSNIAGMWQNPNDGFGSGCTTWTTESTCDGSTGSPDFAFRIDGYADLGIY